MADQKVKEMEPVETQIVEIMPPDIENLIYVVRNKQVMVDSDLAMLYQVETKALNRAVKRNIKRFPEDFCFQLTTEEAESLKCQSGTSKIQESGKKDGRGGRRTLPYVFTEQGISMLASVLHSEVAINVSIGIMRAFVEMRRFIANNALLFERISNVELKQLEYQKKTDEKLEQIFEYISDHEESNQKIFFDGQIYDAFSLLIGLIQKAERKIVLVDGYVDVGTLNILSKKKENVAVTVYTLQLNRIFIDIYGLQDELTPEVEDKDVTVRKADLGRDIRSFISYAVGCMFGRYSLDVDGLAYAGGEWDGSKYVSFAADKDNIIPICDDEYFEDDIVGLFVEFVKTVYGADTLDENLKFIADALGGKGQPKEVIRNYFLSDFYSDHCKIYQKRPIYWLFDSGKKNGFKALIYMHRYQPDTIARIRTDYVHEQQARYRTAIADLEQRIANASTGERVKLKKKLTTLQAQDTEIRVYEEKIHHLADQMISIDLDDGVKKNYAIFQDVLAKIK